MSASPAGCVHGPIDTPKARRPGKATGLVLTSCRKDAARRNFSEVLPVPLVNTAVHLEPRPKPMFRGHCCYFELLKH